MRKILVLLIFFIGLSLVSQLATTHAACGLINPANGSCTISGGGSCNDTVAPFRCCNPQSECNPVLCEDGVSIQTALGCVNIQGSGALGPILNWATGIAGTFVFIMIIISAFMITTAQGDPKRVKAGQELLTSAIAGFILIALAVVILNFIGVKVLGLNLFGFQG